MTDDATASAGPASGVHPKAPWNPAAVGLICFFFSLIPGIVMHAINWERLGYPELKRRRLVTAWFAVAAWLSATLALADIATTTSLLSMVNLAVAVYFYHSQAEFFAKHRAAGGAKASAWPPLLLCLLLALCLLGILLAMVARADG